MNKHTNKQPQQQQQQLQVQVQLQLQDDVDDAKGDGDSDGDGDNKDEDEGGSEDEDADDVHRHRHQSFDQKKSQTACGLSLIAPLSHSPFWRLAGRPVMQDHASFDGPAGPCAAGRPGSKMTCVYPAMR